MAENRFFPQKTPEAFVTKVQLREDCLREREIKGREGACVGRERVREGEKEGAGELRGRG